MISYLSPSALGLYNREGAEAYFIKYFTPRPPFEQTQPMAVGSAFDAYVKAHINEVLGLGVVELEFAGLFEAQVDAGHRDWALEAGRACMDLYRGSGALADLMTGLAGSDWAPRMEDTVRGTVNDVPLLGKPDLLWSREGVLVVTDWKVSGYCSSASPKKGYSMIRGLDKMKTTHKDACVVMTGGLPLNVGHTADEVDKTWDLQEWTYANIIKPGGDYVFHIEQLSFRKGLGRVSSYYLKNSIDYSSQYAALWALVQSDSLVDEGRKAVLLAPDLPMYE